MVVVPEVEPVVSAFRARYAAGSVAHRMPAHITLLIPYVPAARLDGAAIESAREHFSSVAAFDAELVAVGRFDEHVWLAPSPHDRFVELIRATRERFPESSRGTALRDPVPHLTVGKATAAVPIEAVVRAAEAELSPRLPLRFRAASATLFVETPGGRWEQVAVLPFGL